MSMFFSCTSISLPSQKGVGMLVRPQHLSSTSATDWDYFVCLRLIALQSQEPALSAIQNRQATRRCAYHFFRSMAAWMTLTCCDSSRILCHRFSFTVSFSCNPTAVRMRQRYE